MLRLKGVLMCTEYANVDKSRWTELFLRRDLVIWRNYLPLLQSRSTDATKHEIQHASPPTIFLVPAAVAGVLMLALGLEEDE